MAHGGQNHCHTGQSEASSGASTTHEPVNPHPQFVVADCQISFKKERPTPHLRSHPIAYILRASRQPPPPSKQGGM